VAVVQPLVQHPGWEGGWRIATGCVRVKGQKHKENTGIRGRRACVMEAHQQMQSVLVVR
jgi:hypothetical protein